MTSLIQCPYTGGDASFHFYNTSFLAKRVQKAIILVCSLVKMTSLRVTPKRAINGHGSSEVLQTFNRVLKMDSQNPLNLGQVQNMCIKVAGSRRQRSHVGLRSPLTLHSLALDQWRRWTILNWITECLRHMELEHLRPIIFPQCSFEICSPKSSSHLFLSDSSTASLCILNKCQHSVYQTYCTFHIRFTIKNLIQKGWWGTWWKEVNITGDKISKLQISIEVSSRNIEFLYQLFKGSKYIVAKKPLTLFHVLSTC